MEIQRKQQIEVVPDYAFSGFYSWGEVLAMLCERGKCRLSLPTDFYGLHVPLAIYEKDFKSAFRALKLQASADGWDLTLSGKTLSARRSIAVDSAYTFVSCLDSSVVSVPRRDWQTYVRSDSLRCLSMHEKERFHADSVKHYKDSLLHGYDLRNYQLEYYSYSSMLLEQWGIKWSDVLASGDFFSKPDIPLGWAIQAMGTMDSLFVFRSVQFRIDSTLSLTWGNTASEMDKVFNDNGVVTTSYADKDYGMTINLQRSENRLKIDYSFTQNDDTKQKISGASSALLGDTLLVVGYYKSRNNDYRYVPFLGHVPVLGYLFRWREYTDDVKFFVLRCIPKTEYNFRVESVTDTTARPPQPFTARGVADSLVVQFD